MAKSSEYRMAIKIAGEIEKSLYNCTDLTRKELNKIAREAAYASSKTKDSFSNGLRESEPFFNGLEKTATKTFKTIAVAAAAAGTAIVGIGTMAAQAGIEYESAFAGIKKTTNATASEYGEMRKEILAMTREIPASAAEIAEVAEAAGQLGIEKENLMSFSRTMIDLGESTNLTATEGASDLAKFANITDMAAENYGRLGSTIVDLGNNFATTEADIVAMATNLASAGELAGFTEPQIMAIATAMSSVGIEADAGGSSMSKLIKKVQVAVETGSASLKDYAAVAGKSVEEFKEDFEKDGLTAVSAFISGLNDVERNGKSATVILDEMGLTEVRLSNTLLSLANAGDLMERAVSTANNAWEANTALTKEASQRYETTESKLAVMQNGFSEMGVAIYDQFNEPLREGIDIITDLVHEVTADIADSNVIHDIAENIVKGLPSAINVLKEAAQVGGDLAQPFLAVGGFLVDHPGIITGTIAGVGTALTTYKVATNVTALVSSLKTLGKVGSAIMGFGGAVGVLIGVGTAAAKLTLEIKKMQAEAKKANLDSHFGKITLSMQEMEDVAAHILSEDSFGQLRQSISELEELDGISESIDDAVTELNRMNWKISLGMELSEDEREQYKRNIASYVSDMQAYVEQEQYAISLSIGVLTGEDLENSNIVTQLNEFYGEKSEELRKLGEDLNRAVTDGWQDGFLDIDEAKTITDIQKQMADIKASLAMGSYEANLDLIGMKYAGGELDAETYKQMLEEIEQQKETARQQYDEDYVAANQLERRMLAEGAITEEEYNANMKELEKGHLEQVSALDVKGNEFAIGTVMQQYSSELEGMPEWLYDETGKQLEYNLNYVASGAGPNEHLNWMAEDVIDSIDIDKYTQSNLNDIFEIMKPTMEQMENLEKQYMEADMTIPEAFGKSLSDMRMLGALSGDVDAMWGVIGEVAESDEYQEAIKAIEDARGYLPETIEESIEKNQYKIEHAVEQSVQDTQEAYTRLYGQSYFEVPIHIKALPDVSTTVAPYSDEYYADAATRYIAQNVNTGHKDGGIFDTPHVAWFAEEGPEAAIPIDGSQNAINLWQKTGEMLGVFNEKSRFRVLYEQLTGEPGDSINNTVNNSEEDNKFTYSPTYNFYGDAPSKKDLDEHIEDSFDEWEEMMNRWIRNNQRLNFY